VLRLWNPVVTRDSNSLMISESKGVFGLSNPSVTHDTSSLMISKLLRAVSGVESTRHPGQEFVDDL